MRWVRWSLNVLARLRRGTHSGITYAKSSTVDFWRISMRPNCVLRIGDGTIVGARVIFDRQGAEVVIGSNSYLGRSLIVAAQRVEIGNDVLVSWGCQFVDHNSHPMDWRLRVGDAQRWSRGEKDWSTVKMAPIRIGDHAWIGFNVLILKGVTIGEGAIVGAGSVVTKDVPPFTVVAGNPAQIIRVLSKEEA